MAGPDRSDREAAPQRAVAAERAIKAERAAAANDDARASRAAPRAERSRVAASFASILPLAIGMGLALAIKAFFDASGLDYYAKVSTDIGINVILAVSLNLVNGFTGQFSIGHAGFMAVGGYTSVALTYYTSFALWGDHGVHGGFLGAGEWLMVAGCLCGGLLAAAVGYVVGLPSLRLRGDYLAIVTLGFGEIVRVILQQTQPVLKDAADVHAASPFAVIAHLGGALGFTGIPKYTNLFWVFTFVTITLIVSYRIKYSSAGRAFLSIREDEIAAESMGVPVAKYKVRAFVLAALFAGIAGGLFAHESGTALNPRELAFQKSFDIVIMVVLGGMGSISGAAIAAALLTILPEALREFADYRMIVYALSLIVMMIVRPQGLFGVREIWDLVPFRRKPEVRRA
jgi:branched-chain amino acid transport system permease protein